MIYGSVGTVKMKDAFTAPKILHSKEEKEQEVEQWANQFERQQAKEKEKKENHGKR